MRKVQAAVIVIVMILCASISGALYMDLRGEARNINKAREVTEDFEETDITEKPETSDEDTIKLGLVLAVSGIKSDSDKGSLEGAELAVEKLNSEGGALGKEFELVLFDNRGTPIGSKRAAEKAVVEGVAGVIGPERSSYALASAPVLQEEKIPMITHLSTHTGVTKIGDYIFRACYTDEFQGEILGKYAAKEMNSERAVILRMIDEDYSWELSERFRESYESYGGKVEWIGNYKAKDMDYSNMVETVKKIDPDLIFIAGYAKDMGFIARQADEIGIESDILTGDGVGSVIYSFGGKAIDGLKAASHWHRGMDSEENRDFLDRYSKKYGKPIYGNEAAALSYDSTLILGEAIKRGESLEGAAIKEELYRISEFEGTTGTYSFDEDGDPIGKDLVIIEYNKGYREILREYR